MRLIFLLCFVTAFAQSPCDGFKLYVKTSTDPTYYAFLENSSQFLCSDNGTLAVSLPKLGAENVTQMWLRYNHRFIDIERSVGQILQARTIGALRVSDISFVRIDKQQVENKISQTASQFDCSYQKLCYYLTFDLNGTALSINATDIFDETKNMMTYPFWEALKSLNTDIYVGKGTYLDDAGELHRDELVYRVTKNGTTSYYDYSQNPTQP